MILGDGRRKNWNFFFAHHPKSCFEMTHGTATCGPILRSPRPEGAGVRISFLSVAFAFEMRTLHRSRAISGGPSTGRTQRFRWHPACDQQGQSCDWWMFVRILEVSNEFGISLSKDSIEGKGIPVKRLANRSKWLL